MAINGVPCMSLLDTGATVSTISESFYMTYLKDKTALNSIDKQLDIECADGQLMPYLGYIMVDLATYGLSSVEILQDCIF